MSDRRGRANHHLCERRRLKFRDLDEVLSLTDMASTPLVSVVIPTHNRRDLLQETIASLTEQTMKDWEVIVVDDASTDGTCELIESSADDRIRAIRLEVNQGKSAARRHGLNVMRAGMVIFLDDDDLLRPRALERLGASLAKHPEAVGSIGANVEFDSRGHRRRILHPRRAWVRTVWPELLWGWSATPSRVLVRREQVAAAGGWDPQVETAHDTDLWLRMSLLGPFAFVPYVVCEKRAHEGQSRPANTAEIQTNFRARFVDSLPDPLIPRAAMARDTREHTKLGEEMYLKGEMRSATREFFRAARSSSELLRSPLVRPYLVRDLLKASAAAVASSLLGPRLLAKIRQGSSVISKRLLRRDPGGHRTMKTRPPRPP